MIAAQHGHGERRPTLVICGLDVCAELDEKLQHRVIGPSGKEAKSVRGSKRSVQRCVPVFEPRSAAQEAIGIFFDELLNKITIAQRHCGKNVMACPALEEQIDDRFIALARGPADHPAVVQVSGAVNVSASIEEKADAVERSIRRREMERRRVVADVASVWVRALFEV